MELTINVARSALIAVFLAMDVAAVARNAVQLVMDVVLMARNVRLEANAEKLAPSAKHLAATFVVEQDNIAPRTDSVITGK